MKISAASRFAHSHDEGTILLFLSLMLVAVCGVTALALDVGMTYQQQRRIQIAADAGTFAATELLAPLIDDATIMTEAQEVGIANSLLTAEIPAIECGYWDRDLRTFIPCADPCSGSCVCLNCGDAGANAVRMVSHRQVPTTFGRVLGMDFLFPVVESISAKLPAQAPICIRPFGIETSLFDDGPDLIEVGEEFTISRQAPGNWGKLDLGGYNMSSGVIFEEAMLNGLCGIEVSIGDVVEAGTGFSGPLGTAFEPLIGKEILLSLVSDFSPGNSQPVALEDFIKVKLLEQDLSGVNWTAKFLLIERGATLPEDAANPPLVRRLVK